ncbi:hypothetical protein [Aquirhabdus sp.]|uniref:hypothetical protein n=1 Tax=Aquirhabdus sp. TaxID=2824160 RepID=UPI00396C40B8
MKDGTHAGWANQTPVTHLFQSTRNTHPPHFLQKIIRTSVFPYPFIHTTLLMALNAKKMARSGQI